MDTTKKEESLFDQKPTRPELVNAIKLLVSIGASYVIEYKDQLYTNTTKPKKTNKFKHPDIHNSQVANLAIGESFGWEIEGPRVTAAHKKISFIPTALGWEPGSARTEVLQVTPEKSIVQLIRIK